MWQLLAVLEGGAPAGSAEANLVGRATPSPRVAMRRSDRMMSVVARRAPSVIRGLARLTATRGG